MLAIAVLLRKGAGAVLIVVSAIGYATVKMAAEGGAAFIGETGNILLCAPIVSAVMAVSSSAVGRGRRSQRYQQNGTEQSGGQTALPFHKRHSLFARYHYYTAYSARVQGEKRKKIFRRRGRKYRACHLLWIFGRIQNIGEGGRLHNSMFE